MSSSDVISIVVVDARAGENVAGRVALLRPGDANTIGIVGTYRKVAIREDLN
jgi:hypothetical protein